MLGVEQPESPKSPMIMVAGMKKMMSDEGPSSSTMLVADNQSPLSTISSIVKNSPGGKKLIADWIKVLENEQSHDAKYYYKYQDRREDRVVPPALSCRPLSPSGGVARRETLCRRGRGSGDHDTPALSLMCVCVVCVLCGVSGPSDCDKVPHVC